MRFIATDFDGVFLVEPDAHKDERGFFARLWCAQAFAKRGLEGKLAQASMALSSRTGTLRGLHYQRAPFAECKLVRCIRGAIYDVVVDLRPHSPTYLHWQHFALDADNRAALYIPEGCAHGYQTLADATEVLYQMTAPYHPAAEAGIRWDDPLFRIQWPLTPTVISAKDRQYADFSTPRAA